MMNNTKMLLQSVSSSEIVFAFDLHGVLLKPRMYQIFKILMRGLKTSSFFSYLSIICNIPFWYKLYTEGAISEKKVFHLMEKTGFSKHFFITLLDNQRINDQLIKLIIDLKKQGYSLVIASNIWRDLFVDVLRKFPELATLFNDYYIPDMNNYVEKPDERFYVHFKKYLTFKKINYKYIVFIDDLWRNVIAAEREPKFIALRYAAYKQLIKDLTVLGVKL